MLDRMMMYILVLYVNYQPIILIVVFYVVYDVYIISSTLDAETGQRFNNTPQIT